MVGSVADDALETNDWFPVGRPTASRSFRLVRGGGFSSLFSG
jgi:hypothetical protein